MWLYEEDKLSGFLTGVRGREKDSEEFSICLCLREVYENVRDNLWDSRISGKKSNSGKEKITSKSQIEYLIIRLFVFLLHRYYICIQEWEIVGNEALWAAGISSLLLTHTQRYNVKERAFSSQHQQPLCTCSLACPLMFSGGVFSLKHVSKDELTITLAEYP